MINQILSVTVGVVLADILGKIIGKFIGKIKNIYFVKKWDDVTWLKS